MKDEGWMQRAKDKGGPRGAKCVRSEIRGRHEDRRDELKTRAIGNKT